MIVIDANILIYASNGADEQHARAVAWLQKVLSSTEPIGLSWSVIHAYLRLITNRRVVPEPFTIEEAIQVVNEWLEHPVVSVLNPGARYWATLRDILVASQLRGDIINDAHIAALAVENDADIYTADQDFQRFPGVRVINPLA